MIGVFVHLCRIDGYSLFFQLNKPTSFIYSLAYKYERKKDSIDKRESKSLNIV